MAKITPMLWYDRQAEEAANFYVGIFPRSRITGTTRYGAAVPDRQGSVMAVAFELSGQHFTGLNGGPQFRFSEAISFVVDCADQAEIDEYWEKLSEGGEKGPCGWLKDRFGLSWQIVPSMIKDLVGDPDPERSQRAMAAMMKMSKLDIAGLKRARGD